MAAHAALSDTVSFNTQPPEGGWFRLERARLAGSSFNTQPPEGGWDLLRAYLATDDSFNTQPPEGGWASARPASLPIDVSTHSRLKAAGACSDTSLRAEPLFQHTAA